MDLNKNSTISKGCAAADCHLLININSQSEDRAFRFPKDIERWKAWAIAMNRGDWVPDKNSYVCHKHFVTGEPSMDPNHPDYFPSIFAYDPYSVEKANQKLIEYQNLLCDADGISEPMTFDLTEYIWGEKDDFKLLDLVKQNKHVYDKSHKDHGNQAVIDITWQLIAKNMRRPVEGCQIRFNHLYERFCTILKDRKELESTSERLKSFLQKMMFLWDYVEEEIDRSDTEEKRRKKSSNRTVTRSSAAYKRALANKHSMVSTNKTVRIVNPADTEVVDDPPPKDIRGEQSSESNEAHEYFGHGNKVVLSTDIKDGIGSNEVFVNIVKRYLDRIEDEDKLSDLRFRILTLLTEYV